jgi:hypothetical protein
MEIPNKLKEEISQYCNVNNIENVDTFIVRMLKQGFNIEKYGLLSPGVPKHSNGDDIQPTTQVNINTKDKIEKKTDLYGE